MALHGYYGNHDELHNGTGIIKAASGDIEMGKVGDLTTAEVSTLISRGIDVRPVGNGNDVRTNFNTFTFKRGKT